MASTATDIRPPVTAPPAPPQAPQAQQQSPIAPVPPEEKRNVWPIMSGVLLAMLLASLDQTIVGTAMPRIIADLQGFDQYAWVTTAYMLTSTVSVPLYGKLSDIFGRKLMFLIGVVVFVGGSALSGAAQTMTQLILFRGLQGLGAGALMPIALAIVGDLFPPKERGKVQGLTGAVFGLTSIIGPSIGGWITDNTSWRWVFYVNLPVGVIAFLVLIFLMPPLRTGKRDVVIDFGGALLLVAGVVPLLLAFTWAGTTYAWESAQIISLLAGSAIVLVAFTLYELRHRAPILEPRLFTNQIFLVSVLVTGLMGAAMMGGIMYIPLFAQAVVGVSATSSGAILTPLMVTAIAGSIVSGQLMSRWGRYRYIAMFGLLVMIGGTYLLTRLTVHAVSTDILVAMIVMGLGLGFGMSLYTIVVQNAFPISKLGQVTSALTFFRSIGGTIGIAVMGSVLTSSYSSALNKSLSPIVKAALPASKRAALDNPQVLVSPTAKTAMTHAFAQYGARGEQILLSLTNSIKDSLTSALHGVFISSLVIAAVAFVLVLFLKELPLRGNPTAGQNTEAQPEAPAVA
jgi:EmrB/QacA subfamily drug resistance transporter